MQAARAALTQRSANVYNAASDRYDHPANSFWARFGEATVRRAHLCPGERVLDVCCGSGASALPAAEIVGESGYVLGVDVATRLVARARAKASVLRGINVEFRVGDMLELGEPAESFDAVVCVFGIFFATDMAGAVRELWRLVRPGGRLVITTWGTALFEPMNSVFWRAVREVRPELYRGWNPWDRIDHADSLRGLFLDSRVSCRRLQIEDQCSTHVLTCAEDWWTLVLGSGYRGVVDRLSTAERDHVRVACAREFAERNVMAVGASVLYAVAHK